MIQTRDIFLAAYLKSLPYACYVEVEKTGRDILFRIDGEKIGEHEAFYRQGWAVSPLEDFKQVFYELLNLSGQAIRPID
jgi:hypothetical protein